MTSFDSVKVYQSSFEYIKKHSLEYYLQDALHLIKFKKPVNKVLFLHQYFDKASRGEHIIGREFQYINATAYNRKCFAVKLLEIVHLSNYSAYEAHQFAELISLDIPSTIFQLFCNAIIYKVDNTAMNIRQMVLSMQPTDVSLFTKYFVGYFTNYNLFEPLYEITKDFQNEDECDLNQCRIFFLNKIDFQAARYLLVKIRLMGMSEDTLKKSIDRAIDVAMEQKDKLSVVFFEIFTIWLDICQ
ncbi:hypothetical protein HDV06_002260 [Boothiomyces sp. JEL0866]|nr:hypothetical protein HDV06_002260 [Boothiomyces sp. JEL0866]